MKPVLEGVRVADFTAVMAGASGAMFLADLGADVIKVESVVGGDFSRGALPFLFQAVNRNKRSLAVDLATDTGVAIAKRLIATCDVMLQGFRPGALDRKGLGAEPLRAADPRLIYASLSGFGLTGPGKDRRGIDQLVQAETGMANVMGGVNQRLGLIDAAAGIAIGQAVLAALYRREREGIGAELDINLFDTSLWLQMLPIAEYSVTRVPPEQPDEYSLRIPTMGVFKVVGGRVFMSILLQRDWLKLCEIVNAPDLVTDTRFSDYAARGRNGKALKPLLADVLRSVEISHLLVAAEREGLMMSAVRDYDDVFADPQSAANETFHVVPDWNGVEVTHVRAPYRFVSDDAPPSTFTRPPMLGEHSSEVLDSLGYGPDEVAAWKAAGIIGGT